MAVTPKDAFDFAIARARHQLTLYDILHDSRQRNIRRDWKERFCEFMRWPKSEKIVRVDGASKQSMLILRESVGLTRSEFAHEYLSEILRGVVTASVSALDRYIHDQVTDKSLQLLRRAEADVPKELRQIKVPLLTAKRSMEKLRGDSSARPGALLKAELREILHKEETFQSVASVEKGAKMLGIRDFWGRILAELPRFSSKGEVQEELRAVTHRRNQIVHEADLIIQERPRDTKLRDIGRSDAENALAFVEEFVFGVDRLVAEDC